MPSLKQKLPPLSALVTFEAAARHLNFTAAGEELHVTQAAVSRQIKALEAYLGVPMFERGHRCINLTAPATKLQQAVSMGLEHIATAVSQIRNNTQSGQLTVSATIAFASLWLNPRLADFQNLYPDIDVRILATDRDVDLQSEAVDLAFSCGDAGQHSGVTATYLFDDEVFPVCSPAYMDAHPELKQPEDLLNHNLLHLDEDHWQAISWEAIDWPFWLKSQGIDPLLQSRGLRVNNYPLLLQTAINSQGVALGWRHLVSDYLEKGLLIRPFDTSLCTRRGYYLVESNLSPLTQEAQVFRDWIFQQIKA
ncbi:MAG: transcriptional regulator GcvA [Amphritea sp.]